MAAVERQETNNIVAFHQPNAERQRQALSRLRHCVALLQEAEALPLPASERSRALIAKSKEIYDGVGFSQSTLHKLSYLALWHPAYLAPQVDDGPLPDPWDDALPEACVNPVPEPVYMQFAMEVMGGGPLLLPPARDGVSVVSGSGGQFQQSLNSLTSFHSLENSSKLLSVTSFPDSASSNHFIPSSPSTSEQDSSSISFPYPPVAPAAASPAHKHSLSNTEGALLQPPSEPLPEALEACHACPPCYPTLETASPAEIASSADAARSSLREDELLEARRNALLRDAGIFLYAGSAAYSLVSLQGKAKMQVRGVRCGEPVQLCPDSLHSNPRLIYVKPLQGADDWRGGIAVRWDALNPLVNLPSVEERPQGVPG
jgi:hypothetical protein